MKTIEYLPHRPNDCDTVSRQALDILIPIQKNYLRYQAGLIFP